MLLQILQVFIDKRHETVGIFTDVNTETRFGMVVWI